MIIQLDCLAWLCQVLLRLLCAVWPPMYSNQRLSSIPEKCEAEEASATKWVPKQKHEVLKAKYKCLKKLFQVYDASLINLLPDTVMKTDEESPRKVAEEPEKIHKSSKKKKRRTHKRTSECGETASDDNRVCANAIKDLKIKKCALGPTLVDHIECDKPNYANVKSIKAEFEQLSSESSVMDNEPPVLPHYPTFTYRPKMSKMQTLKYKLFGQRPKEFYEMGKMQYCPMFAPPLMSQELVPGRGSRRRVRLRRSRANKSLSCGTVGDAAVLLRRMQAVQNSCLAENTPRSCPFPGCNMTLHGIINYNDHLRLCHCPNRKFVCHYCHEGFDTAEEKLSHENEHIGIFTAVASDPGVHRNPSNLYQKCSKSSGDKDVQCDVVSEEKLKKIVSYFDKIGTGDSAFNSFAKRNESCPGVYQGGMSDLFSRHSKLYSRDRQKEFPVACPQCGDYFRAQKQLNEHMQRCHGPKNNKKFHSVCVLHSKNDEGNLNVNAIDSSRSEHSRSVEVSKSNLSCDYDTSTNIVYYNSTSLESVCKKSSILEKLVKKVKSSKTVPKWEPAASATMF